MTLNLTTNGKELLTLVLAGETTLTFTKLSIGSGADAGEDASALSSPVLSTTFAKQEALDNYAKLTAIFDNSSITTKTAVTETGIFADDPDNPGTDLLYAYGYANAAEADYIPPASEAALEVQQTVYVYIAEAKTFSVTIDPNAAALATDLEAHIEDTDNPHDVTCSQIGAAEEEHTHTADEIVSGTLTLNTTGNAATATTLETARTIRTNLASTSAASFDGSANITPGVTGILPLANGGTGTTTGHLGITQGVDSTSTAAPSAGGTFTAIDGVTKDNYGHVTAVNTKTVTLPSAAETAESAESATTATTLETARTIDGVSFDGSAAIIHYGTCSTAADTEAKEVDCTGFLLVTGARIVVKFTYVNTTDAPTLNVNDTGAVAIVGYGTTVSNVKSWCANSLVEFIYDGTSWVFLSIGCEGQSCTATGNYSHAEGSNTTATGDAGSHAEGRITTASAYGAHAEGYNTTASGEYSHAQGYSTEASGNYSHAEGYTSAASAYGAHAEGHAATASGSYSHAEGYGTIVSGAYSHAEGENNAASAENYGAFGDASHVEGWITSASGKASHTEGNYTKAISFTSHAEGYFTTAGNDSYDDSDTNAIYGCQHAEGCKTTASGIEGAHAEGNETMASGAYSHAEGYCTNASTTASHAEGYHTEATNLGSHAGGKYNSEMASGDSAATQTGDVFVLGNGTGSSSLGNAFRVSYAGEAYGLSAFNSSGADYAEFILPWSDGNEDGEDRVGYFVTIDGDYIRKAQSGEYIAGITSGNPSVVGNGDETYYWKYERDEFDRIVWEDVAVTDENGEETGEVIENGRMKLSDDYDVAQTYIPRKDRPEWDYVGMVGVLPVRDDGTCVAGGWCCCGADGIGTAAESRGWDTYYVIEHISDSVVRVVLK